MSERERERAGFIIMGIKKKKSEGSRARHDGPSTSVERLDLEARVYTYKKKKAVSINP